MKISQSGIINIAANPSQTAELFSIIGSTLWDDRLDVTLFSGNGYNAGSVFSINENDGYCIYIIIDFKPEHGRILYAQTKPGLSAGTIEFRISETDTGHSQVAIQLSLTALTLNGHDELSQIDDFKFLKMIRKWESNINNYLSN